MSPQNWQLVFIVVYFAVYLGLTGAWIYFLRSRRKTRWPFKDSDKLLRGPGEGLRRRILALDESLPFELSGFMIAALFAWALLAFLAKAVGLSGWSAVFIIVAGMMSVAVLSVWRIGRVWHERSSYFLGWFGERLTAEKLQPLQLLGYRVFHDVPCEPGNNGFNIDHVVVGPTGVSVVEVKTRRKGNARPGYTDHEVSFDGRQLDWPWGYDRDGIEQAINEADWLGKWLFERTGIRVPVRAVLTLPGWFVRETPSPRLRVVNPSFLSDAVRGRGEIIFTPQQVDLFRRQLDQRCRDVED